MKSLRSERTEIGAGLPPTGSTERFLTLPGARARVLRLVNSLKNELA